jgi:hypothetical protein
MGRSSAPLELRLAHQGALPPARGPRTVNEPRGWGHPGSFSTRARDSRRPLFCRAPLSHRVPSAVSSPGGGARDSQTTRVYQSECSLPGQGSTTLSVPRSRPPSRGRRGRIRAHIERELRTASADEHERRHRAATRDAAGRCCQPLPAAGAGPGAARLRSRSTPDVQRAGRSASRARPAGTGAAPPVRRVLRGRKRGFQAGRGGLSLDSSWTVRKAARFGGRQSTRSAGSPTRRRNQQFDGAGVANHLWSHFRSGW